MGNVTAHKVRAQLVAGRNPRGLAPGAALISGQNISSRARQNPTLNPNSGGRCCGPTTPLVSWATEIHQWDMGGSPWKFTHLSPSSAPHERHTPAPVSQRSAPILSPLSTTYTHVHAASKAEALWFSVCVWESKADSTKLHRSVPSHGARDGGELTV